MDASTTKTNGKLSSTATGGPWRCFLLKHLQRGVTLGEISPCEDLKSLVAMLFAPNNGIG